MTPVNVPIATAVHAVVVRWSGKHPELAERLERAAALVDNVKPGDRSNRPSTYFVEGSDGHRYCVKINRRARTSTCSCEDHHYREIKCKHILACALIESAKA